MSSRGRGLILSGSLFGDGSAAFVVGESERPGWSVLGFEFLTVPEYRQQLRFITRNARLHNVLGPQVPTVAAEVVAQTVVPLLERYGIERDRVRFWALHAGGRKVIDRIQSSLSLSDEEVRFAKEVLLDCGNMSSPTVLFVLRLIWDQGGPQPGDYAVMAAFGAGFSMYAALLQYG